MKFRTKPFALATSAAVALGVLMLSPHAANAQDVDTSEADAIVSSIAPQLLGTQGQKSEVTVSIPNKPGSDAHRAPVISPSVTTGEAKPVSFTLDGAMDAQPTSSGEFQVFATGDSHASTYVQPTNNGVRVLTAIDSSAAPTSYSYTFDVPPGTTFERTADAAAFRLMSPLGDVLGYVDTPWARDSAGKDIPTSFTWNGTTLTQSVDLSNQQISYPVLADPDWSYGAEFTLSSTNVGIAWYRLHNCFNCYFPVDGAPATFPAAGQDLPLFVSLGVTSVNFHCTMGDYTIENPAREFYEYYFDAADGHIDGLGSAIYFDLYKTLDGRQTLSVAGFVHNDFPGGLPNPVYVAFATQKWQTFADNLSD